MANALQATSSSLSSRADQPRSVDLPRSADLPKRNVLDEILRSGLRISDVIQSLVPGIKLKKYGKPGEFECLCMFHKEDDKSFTLNDEKGVFLCHGCGAKGSMVDFVKQHQGMDSSDALAYLCSLAHVPPLPRRKSLSERKVVVPLAFQHIESDEAASLIWPLIKPAPEPAGRLSAFNPNKNEYRTIRPKSLHIYRDFDGSVLHCVARVEYPDKLRSNGKPKKTFVPLSWRGVPVGQESQLHSHECAADPGGSWWTKLYSTSSDLRPLYGLERIEPAVSAFDSLNILLVEGEKAADAGLILLKDHADWIVLSPNGGSEAAGMADFASVFAYLEARAKDLHNGFLRLNIYQWPDADPTTRDEISGKLIRKVENARRNIALKLADNDHILVKGYRVFFINPEGYKNCSPDEYQCKNKGWDIADGLEEGWCAQDLFDFIKTNADPVISAVPVSADDLRDIVRQIGEFEVNQTGAGLMQDANAFETLNEGGAPAPERPIATQNSATIHPFSTRNEFDGNGFRARQRFGSVDGGDLEPVFLGFREQTYFMQSRRTYEIIGVKAKDLTSAAMMFQISTREFWSSRFLNEKNIIDWAMAADYVIHQCALRGVWDPARCLGRGTWKINDQHFAVNYGDRIEIRPFFPLDGEPVRTFTNFTDAELLESRSVYISASSINGPSTSAFTGGNDERLLKFYSIMKSIPWQMAGSGFYDKLMIGWMVVSPLAGLLKWRPHIWFAGERGSGKSWIISEIIRKIIGQWSVNLSSITTEPGLRRTLRGDALPIIFEEASVTDANDMLRIAAILKLARVASSQDGLNTIVQTDGDLRPVSWTICNSFLVSAMDTHLSASADETRFAVLRITKRVDAAIFEEKLARPVRALLDEDFSSAFLDRILARTGRIIEANNHIVLFLSRHVEMRVAQVYGGLLAGYFGLTEDGSLPTETDAEIWLHKLGVTTVLNQIMQDASESSDALPVFNRLMQEPVMVDTNTPAGKKVTTVGLLCTAAISGRSHDDVSPELAKHALMKIGIKTYQKGTRIPKPAVGKAPICENGGIFILNKAYFVEKATKGSISEVESTLLTMPGVFKTQPERLGGQAPARGIFIPAENLVSAKDDE